MTARLRLVSLLFGRVDVSEVTVTDPVLHLVRQSPGKDNWTFGRGGSSSPLSSTHRLTITGGAFDVVDTPADLRLSGVFSQNGRTAAALPFALSAQGSLKGAALALQAQGGPINGAHASCPMVVDLVDGMTRVRLQGSSGRPLDFNSFDFHVQASGPNLADLNYIFGLLAPNSPPFRLTARAQRNGSEFNFTNMQASIGHSDVAGQIHSDCSSERPRIQAKLTWGTLYAKDLRTLFAARPPHLTARSNPGVPQPPHAGERWLLSDSSFQVAEFRKADVDARQSARQIVGLTATPITGVSAHLSLQHGRLALAPLSFGLSPGQVTASITIDASKPIAELQVSADVRRVQLSAVRKSMTKTLDAKLDASLALKGRGRSLHAAAADAVGRASIRLREGMFMRSKAAVLSGDLLQAVNGSLSDRDRRTPLRCGVAELEAEQGSLRIQKLTVVTGTGDCDG